jgi:phosphatidyl-myo-inositol dimannoside synthase
MTAQINSGVGFHVLALFPQLTGHGGVQLAARETAAALDQIAGSSDFSTSFLSLNDPREGATVSFAGRKISFIGFGRNKFAFSLTAIRQVRNCSRNVSKIVLAFHPNLGPPAYWAVQLSSKAKLIVVSHGVDVWQRLSRLRQYGLKHAAMAIAPSQFTCEALQRIQAVPKEKIRLLPWALNPDVLELASSESCSIPPPDFPQGRVVLSVARWSASERYKGADELISAAAQLRQEFPDLQLVFIGGGDDVSRLKELARTSGAGQCVHFLGEISDQELAGCYAQAEFFALPSTGEGFGFVFLEAMAFQKPVIAARAGGATDIVENDVNGLLVPPGALPALKVALGRLLRDDALRIRLGQRAEETVRREFLFPSFVERLKAILNEVGVL